jgi:ABC-type branched-subunit amino acid transport system permease subunit
VTVDRLITRADFAIGIAVAVIVAVIPAMLDMFSLLQLTAFVCLAILSLSLGFIWGFGGILSFGQAAFFGLGAYAYAISVINLGDSTLPLILSIIVPSLFAALLGYLMFYGRISDVYVGVITLTVTLILYNVVNSTAGDQYRIGSAALGGFNGIPAVPGINLPFMPSTLLDIAGNWYLSAGALAIIYLGMRLFLRSHPGRVIVAIRENETRAALLGYDTRFYKLLVFVIGSGVAGLGGALYTAWGSFVSPTIFGLSMSAQVIVWIIVGGRGTLAGPVIGCVALQYLTTSLGTQQTISVSLVLGALLLVCVLVLPAGVLPLFASLVKKLPIQFPGRIPYQTLVREDGR